MNKTEVKKLLKKRDALLKIYMDCKDDSNKLTESAYIDKICYNNTSDSIYRIDKGLLRFVQDDPIGEWLMQIKGMTVDIAAGLIAYFDVRGKECASQFISYCGVDNCNNPHNNIVGKMLERLKDNFMNEPDSLYRKLGNDRFYQELRKNVSTDTARIRADRRMKKVFTSHLFEEMYLEEYGVLPCRHNDIECEVIEPEVPYTK